MNSQHKCSMVSDFFRYFAARTCAASLNTIRYTKTESEPVMDVSSRHDTLSRSPVPFSPIAATPYPEAENELSSISKAANHWSQSRAPLSTHSSMAASRSLLRARSCCRIRAPTADENSLRDFGEGSRA